MTISPAGSRIKRQPTRLVALLLLAVSSPAPALGQSAEPLVLTQLAGAGSLPAAAVQQPATPVRPPLPPLPVTQLDDRRRLDDLDAVHPFSLRFAERLPIRDLLLLLVRDTSFSIVPDPAVGGTFLGELKDVTLRQALELILYPMGLDYSVQHTFIQGDFDGLLRAFAAQGRVTVLSSPRVVAMNNEPALMRIGTQDVFFVTTSQVDAVSGRMLQTTVAPQAITEGVGLSVTRQISADGFIHMNIVPSVTERTGQAVSRFGDVVPILSVREADTLVRLLEGETVVIAGLMQDIERSRSARVPVLGDLPVVGRLFRRDARRRTKTDLVILLTPTVLTPGQIAADAAGPVCEPAR
jgi:type II secretory pathway component HofQ